MKLGKEINVKQNKNFRTSYGTIDNKNLKTIYVKVATWITPITEMDDYSSSVLKLRRSIKNCISQNLNPLLFRSDIYIVDIDVKKARLAFNRANYLSVDVTLFVKNGGSILSSVIKMDTTRLIGLITDTISRHNDFEYSYRKENYEINA